MQRNGFRPRFFIDGNMTNRNGTVITWNSENLPTQITQSASNSSSFSYAPDKHRYYQSAEINGVAETTVYVGGFEVYTSNGSTIYRHHLMADGREVAEIDLSNSGSSVVEKISYILSDHLGSVDVVTDQTGTPIAQMSFGAFGNRREAGTWLPPVGSAETQADHNADRYGFTHQEMLDNVALIHMNGRVYDPNLGRFLSVDPVFEFPTNTQSLNPYSYVLNNPLSMTDPTGYVASCGTSATTDSKTGDTTVTSCQQTTATDLGSHIAQHGQTTTTTTLNSSGRVISQSASGNGAGLGETADISADRGAGNGAQMTQGAADAQQQPTSHTDIDSPNETSLVSTGTTQSKETSASSPATTEGQEIQLMQKTWKDLPGAIKFWEKKDSAQDLAQYAVDKIKIRQGFASNQTAATCAKGCEPGFVSPDDPKKIVLYAGAALAAGYSQEGGSRGLMFIIAHEFAHTTLRNQEAFSQYLHQHPNLDAYTLGQEERDPTFHDLLPWEREANDFGRAILEGYNLMHPP